MFFLKTLLSSSTYRIGIHKQTGNVDCCCKNKKSDDEGSRIPITSNRSYIQKNKLNHLLSLKRSDGADDAYSCLDFVRFVRGVVDCEGIIHQGLLQWFTGVSNHSEANYIAIRCKTFVYAKSLNYNFDRSVFRLSDNNHSRVNGVSPPAKMSNKCKQHRLLTRSSEWFCIKMFFVIDVKPGLVEIMSPLSTLTHKRTPLTPVRELACNNVLIKRFAVDTQLNTGIVQDTRSTKLAISSRIDNLPTAGALTELTYELINNVHTLDLEDHEEDREIWKHRIHDQLVIMIIILNLGQTTRNRFQKNNLCRRVNL
ncbi:hypothetical protein AGLY_007283 [Aphis glycines]|uniref:Uncharacterized protein n=1 Tax=Aphis glycines TaxID=307491 RepID=A0A6G0TRF2_APHGL|nr:hypothetical protein AGLY_007283 [Aphis glycines]